MTTGPRLDSRSLRLQGPDVYRNRTAIFTTIKRALDTGNRQDEAQREDEVDAAVGPRLGRLPIDSAMHLQHRNKRHNGIKMAVVRSAGAQDVGVDRVNVVADRANVAEVEDRLDGGQHRITGDRMRRYNLRHQPTCLPGQETCHPHLLILRELRAKCKRQYSRLRNSSNSLSNLPTTG